MDTLDIAHPALTLVLVVALLVTLGLLTNINRRLRVSEDRLESLEREQKLYDEALALVRRAPSMAEQPSEGTEGAQRSLREQIADSQRGAGA